MEIISITLALAVAFGWGFEFAKWRQSKKGPSLLEQFGALVAADLIEVHRNRSMVGEGLDITKARKVEYAGRQMRVIVEDKTG